MTTRAKRTLILVIAVIIALFVYVKVQKWLNGHYVEQFKLLSESRRVTAARKLVKRHMFAQSLGGAIYARQENGLLACRKLAQNEPKAVEAMVRLFGFLDADAPANYTNRKLLVDMGQAAFDAVLKGVQQARDDNDPADEHKIRLNSAYLLGELGNSQAVPVLIQVLQKKDMRLAIGTRKRYDYSKYEDWDVKYAACGALLKLGGSEAEQAVSEVSNMLVKRLLDTSADETDRIEAAGALKQIADPSTVPALYKAATTDPNWIVRKLAVQALAQLKDPAAAEALVKVAAAPVKSDIAQPAAYEAALALAEVKAPGTDAALLKLLNSNDWTIRQAAASSLLARKAPAMVATLLKQLRAYQPERRKAAAVMLGKARAKAAVPQLVALLKDQNSEVRAAAAQALGFIGDPSALPALVEAVEDTYYPARKEASAAISRLGTDKALNLLLPKLQSKNPDVREIAAVALGKSKSPKVIPALEAALGDEDPYVAAAAAVSLGDLKVAAAATQITRLLKDPHAEVRRSALEALRELKSPAAAPAVRQVIELDPDEKGGEKDARVRYLCAEVLGFTQDKDSIKELSNLLKDKDHGVRVAAAGALALLGEKRGVKYLHKILKDKQESLDIRRLAAVRLARLGEEEPLEFLLEKVAEAGYQDVAITSVFLKDVGDSVVPRLQELLKDPMGILRATAVKALAQLEKEKAVPEIKSVLLNDELERVQSFAAEALGDIGTPEAKAALQEALEKPDMPQAVVSTIRLQLARF